MLPSQHFAAPDEISNSLMVFHDRTTGRRKWGVFNLSDRTERATADGGMRDGHWRMYWVYADESKPGQETGDVLELWRDPSFRMLNLGVRTYADDADPTKQYHQFQIVCGDETVLVAPDAAMFQRWWARLNEVRKVLQGNADATSDVAVASSSGFASHAAQSLSAPFDFPFDEDEREAVADPNFAPPLQAIAPHALHDTLRYQVGDGRWIIGSCALEPLHGEWRLVWHCSRPNQREVLTELELSRNPDFQFFDESVSDPASLVEQQPDRPPMRPTFAFRVVCGDSVAIFRAEDRYQQRRWLARLTELAGYLAAAGQRDGRAERIALERHAEQQQQLLAKKRQRRRVVETAVARPPGAAGGVNADNDAVVAAEVQATERGLNEVYAWLQAIGMASYTQVLVSEGFDTLARFATITQHDLVSLGVKRGHARAIIDAVRGRSATTWRSTVATLVSLVQTREKSLVADLSSVRVASSRLRSSAKEVHSAIGQYYHGRYEMLRKQELAVVTRFDEIKERKSAALEEQATAIRHLKRTMHTHCRKAQEALEQSRSSAGQYSSAAENHRVVMTAQPMIKRLRQLARPQAVALPSESPAITFVAPNERKQNRAEELLTSHVEGISPMHCTAEPVGADEADFAALGATPGAAAATTPFTLVRVVPRDHLGRQIEALSVAMEHVEITARRIVPGRDGADVDSATSSALRHRIASAQTKRAGAARVRDAARLRLEAAQHALREADASVDAVNVELAQLRGAAAKLAKAAATAKRTRGGGLEAKRAPAAQRVAVRVHGARAFAGAEEGDERAEHEVASALKALLVSLDLGSYGDVLALNGFDSIDRLSLAKIEDLVDVGMQKGHARHLVASLQRRPAVADAAEEAGGKKQQRKKGAPQKRIAALDSSEIHVIVRQTEAQAAAAAAVRRRGRGTPAPQPTGPLLLEIALPRGVRWHAERKQWEAQMFANGRFCHLGYYSDRADAVGALGDALHRQAGGKGDQLAAAAATAAASSQWNGVFEMTVKLRGVEVQGSPFRIQSAPDHVLRYHHPGDDNGVITWIGTERRSRPFQNPVRLVDADVAIEASSIFEGDVLEVTSRDPCDCLTDAEEHPWWCIDLGKQNSLSPTHYTLRNVHTLHHHALRNWVLQGSVDGKAWEPLIEHRNDTSIAELPDEWGAWQLPPAAAENSYRFFCVMLTGPNASQKSMLAIGGIELYGVLTPMQ